MGYEDLAEWINEHDEKEAAQMEAFQPPENGANPEMPKLDKDGSMLKEASGEKVASEPEKE